MNEYSFFRSCTLGAAIAGMLLWLMTSSANEDKPCNFPEFFVFGAPGSQLVFEAERKSGQEASLERIDFLTKLKWSLGLLIPGLTSGDVSVHLYDAKKSGFLARYDHIGKTKFVRFFLARECDGEYRAIPGTISKFSGGSAQETEHTPDNWEGYVGMTFRPKDTTPDVTLKGDLFAFSPSKP